MADPIPCPLCGAVEAVRVAVTPIHLAEAGEERFEWVRCRECRLVRLADPPDEEAVKEYYGPEYLPHLRPGAWGRWAPLIRFAELHQDRGRVRLAEKTVRAGVGGGASEINVLDLGCGRPTFLRALVKKTGWRGVGLDTADTGWVHDPPDTWAGLHLRTGTLGDAKLPADRFHLVTMWHVLEHLSNPREALGQALETTLPGGFIIVEVPDYRSIPRKVQGNSWIGFDSPRHTVVFDPTTLARTLEESGWAVQSIEQHGSMDPWLLWWLGMQAAKGESMNGRLEGAVLPFLVGKVLTWPLAALQRWFPLGAMTAVARKAGG